MPTKAIKYFIRLFFLLVTLINVANAISNGEAKQASISPVGNSDNWIIQATAGEWIFVQIAELSGSNFEPYLQAFDINGNRIADNNGNNSTALYFMAEDTGTYNVTATDSNNNGTGTYKIFVNKSTTDYVVPSGDEGGLLTNGNVHSAVIDLADIDSWSFDAEANDKVFIQIAEVIDGGSFLPTIYVYDSLGNPISYNWGNSSADIIVDIPVAGRYTVIVRDANSDAQGKGSYNLYYTNTGQNISVPANDEGGELINGQNVVGSIELADVDAWQFEASAGESLFIQVAETIDNNNFLPYILLYSPTGQLLNHNWGNSSADIIHTTAEPGKYTLVIKDANNDVTSTGEYKLFYVNANQPFTVPTGDEGGNLANGDSHDGEITLADVDAWSFVANAGDAVLLQVGEIVDNNNFLPYLLVYDPLGNLVTSNYGNTGTDVRFNANIAGKYTAIVRDANGDVSSTGAYKLYYVNANQPLVILEAEDEGGALTNGGVHVGSIKRGDLDSWTFKANAGEKILIQIGETVDYGNFLPSILIYNPMGNLVAENYGNTATHVDFNATLAGTYNVIVKDATADVPNSGDYKLYFQNANQPQHVNDNDHGGELKNVLVHTGKITLGDIDAWTFTGSAGEIAVVHVSESNDAGNFNPFVIMYDPMGNQIASNWGYQSANIEAELNYAGEYTVVIRDANNDVPNTADYNIHFANMGKPFTVGSNDQGGTLSNGATQTGAITQADIDNWNIFVKAGQQINVDISETQDNDSFRPAIYLYDPMGRYIIAAGDEMAASFSAIANLTGNYRIMVRDSSNDVASSGNYQITANISGNSASEPVGSSIRTLKNGELISGYSNGSVDRDKYSLVVKKDEIIHVRAGDLSDSSYFDVALQIFSGSGQLLASSISEYNNDFASITFKVPSDDTLKIVVFNSYGDSSSYVYELSAAVTSQNLTETSGDTARVLHSGELIAGTIRPGDLDVFNFEIKSGEVAHIRAGDLDDSSYFDVGIQIFSSRGELIATSISDYNNDFSSITFNSANDDMLTAVVFNSYNEGGTYDYEISAAIGSQNTIKTAGDSAGNLRNGELLSGTIRPGDIDVFDLIVKKDEVIHVRAGDLSDSSYFDVGLQVLDSAGNFIAASISEYNNDFSSITFKALNNDTLKVAVFNSYNEGGVYDYEISAAISSQDVVKTQGDTAGLLRSGELIAGTMRPGDIDIFNVDVIENEVLHLRAGDLSDSSYFDLGMQVISSKGELLAQSISDYNNDFVSITLKSPYKDSLRVILFNSYNEGGTYNYEISAAVGSQFTYTSNTDSSGVLRSGELLAGSMRPGDLDVYDLSVKKDELIVVRGGDLSDSSYFDVGLQIFNSKGKLLASSISDYNNDFSSVTFKAPADDVLKAVLFNSYNEGGTYNYEVSAIVPSQTTITSSSDQGGRIKNGELKQGSIRPGDIDLFYTYSSPGKLAKVRAGDLSSSSYFDIGLMVVDDKGQLLASTLSDGNDGAAELSFLTPDSPYFKTIIFNSYNEGGTYEYDATVSISGENITTKTNDNGGVILNNQTVSGQITAGDVENFVFAAHGGASITIDYVDQNSSSYFDPSFKIFNSKGKLIEAQSAASTTTFSFFAPDADVYYLMISNNQQQSETAGIYQLTVTGINNNQDTDGDTIIDTREFQSGLNHFSRDTDNDGLDDNVEIDVHNTNPRLADTDSDGVNDGTEVARGTNPLVKDTNIVPPIDDDIPFLPLPALIILASIFGYMGFRKKV